MTRNKITSSIFANKYVKYVLYVKYALGIEKGEEIYVFVGHALLYGASLRRGLVQCEIR